METLLWHTTWRNYVMDLASIPKYDSKASDEPEMVDEADEISSLKELGF